MKGLILTYFLTIVGTVVAPFNPFIGVCIYWIFDIVRPQYMFGWAGTQGSFSQIIAVATILGWAAQGFGDWRFGKAKPIIALFLASSAWALLSAAAAANHDVALGYLIEDLKRVLMFLIGVTTANSMRRIVQLAWVLVGSAGYVALELNMRYLEGFNEAHQIGYGGMDNNCLAISLVPCLSVAVFLGLTVPRIWQKTIAFAAAASIGHIILLTFSRGGMLGMLVSAGLALMVVPKRPRNIAAVATAICIAITLAGPEVRARFTSTFAEETERDGSAQSRIQLWADCIAVMKKYPILGVGPDHFPLISAEFGWPAGKEAHSLWFQMAAELGIAGALFLLFSYLTAIWKLWRVAKSPNSDDTHRGVSCMVVTGLAGFIVSAQFVTIEGLETPLYLVALAIGTLRVVAAQQSIPALKATEGHPVWAKIPASTAARALRGANSSTRG